MNCCGLIAWIKCMHALIAQEMIGTTNLNTMCGMVHLTEFVIKLLFTHLSERSCWLSSMLRRQQRIITIEVGRPNYLFMLLRCKQAF